jgi:hypothetical protein
MQEHVDEPGLSRAQLLWWFWTVVALSILIPLGWIAVARHELNGLPGPNTVGAPVTVGLALIEGLFFDFVLWILAVVVLVVWSAVERRGQLGCARKGRRGLPRAR